jgi:hypothetical protein
MSAERSSTVKTEAPAAAVAVYHKISDLEHDLITLIDGTTAMAVLVEHIRTTPADDTHHDELDLQDAAVWIVRRLEQLAIGIHEKWEAANSLAYDAARPMIPGLVKGRL